MLRNFYFNINWLHKYEYMHMCLRFFSVTGLFQLNWNCFEKNYKNLLGIHQKWVKKTSS